MYAVFALKASFVYSAQPACMLGPLLAQQRNARRMVFAGESIVTRFYMITEATGTEWSPMYCGTLFNYVQCTALNAIIFSRNV